MTSCDIPLVFLSAAEGDIERENTVQFMHLSAMFALIPT